MVLDIHMPTWSSYIRYLHRDVHIGFVLLAIVARAEHGLEQVGSDEINTRWRGDGHLDCAILMHGHTVCIPHNAW